MELCKALELVLDPWRRAGVDDQQPSAVLTVPAHAGDARDGAGERLARDHDDGGGRRRCRPGRRECSSVDSRRCAPTHPQSDRLRITHRTDRDRHGCRPDATSASWRSRWLRSLAPPIDPCRVHVLHDGLPPADRDRVHGVALRPRRHRSGSTRTQRPAAGPFPCAIPVRCTSGSSSAELLPSDLDRALVPRRRPDRAAVAGTSCGRPTSAAPRSQRSGTRTGRGSCATRRSGGVSSPSRPDAPFFNSGVMLVSLEQWREQQVGTRSLALLSETSPLLDQCALNVVLENDWRPLHPAWNVQSYHLTGDESPCLRRRRSRPDRRSPRRSRDRALHRRIVQSPVAGTVRQSVSRRMVGVPRPHGMARLAARAEPRRSRGRGDGRRVRSECCATGAAPRPGDARDVV